MLRWGIALILLGIFLYMIGFAGGSAFIDIGKWVVGAALIIWIISIFLWPGTRGPDYGAPGPL